MEKLGNGGKAALPSPSAQFQSMGAMLVGEKANVHVSQVN